MMIDRSLSFTITMADANAAVPKDASQDEKKPKLKICCACPDSKKVRDNCIVMKGEEECKGTTGVTSPSRSI